MSARSASDSKATTALVVTVGAVVAVAGYRVIKKKVEKRMATPPFKGIPVAPDSHWLLGHMIELNANGFVKGYEKCFVDPADENGLSSFWFLHNPSVSVLRGREVKQILISGSFRVPIPVINIHNKHFLGLKALTALMGKEWRVARSAVHKSFTPSALKSSQTSINQVGMTLAKSLTELIEQSTTKSIQRTVLPMMKMATFDVFGRSVLDMDFQCCERLELSEFANAFDFLTSEYTRRIQEPWNPASLLYFIPTASNRKHARCRKTVRSFIADQIDQAKKRPDDVTRNKHDLLTNILKFASENDELSEDDVSQLLTTLLFGGYDTTSITLSYALYSLAKHPEFEKECVNEINSVLGSDPQELASFPGPENLPFTRSVINETLRLFPPAPTNTRTLEKPVSLCGTEIPQGTDIFIPIWSIQRDPNNYPQPNDMIPERWVRKRQGSGKSKQSIWEDRPLDDTTSSEIPPANRDAFCVFSAGARNCVGRALALQESVTLLAFLIRSLKFDLIESDYEIEPDLCSFVQQPKDHLPMIIRKR